MTSPSFPFFCLRTLCSSTLHQAALLCLQLLSSPHFYTATKLSVCLAAPLPNFISDGAVFPIPSLMRALLLGPVLTLWGGSYQAMAGACFSTGTRVNVPQQRPRDYIWVLACPRKRSCDHAAPEVQRLWKITTHNWCQTSPHPSVLAPTQQTWMFSGVLWDLFLWGGCMASTKCPPKQGNCLSPCGRRTPQTLLSAPGDSPFPSEPPVTELWNF